MKCALFFVAIVIVAVISGCDAGTPKPAAAVSQPTGWDEDIALPIPVDLNPDPNILEIELEAKITNLEFVKGKKTPAWTYNGTVPGPLIRAKVGDKVIVHFKNSLPDSTSIHWHGLRISNDMDGVPGVTQEPIAAGAEFRYEFTVNDAGTFWYHPHINSAAQVGWGLYGPIVVEDPNDPKEFGDDVVLMFSDISVDDEGQFHAVDSGGQLGDLFGREGNILLINGKQFPKLKVRAGKPQRWRVINGARSRYLSISLRNHRLIKLGGDNGLAARSQETGKVIIVPGERADIVFTPSDEPGTTNKLRWRPVERGYGSTFNRPSIDLLSIETIDEPAVIPEIIPTNLRTIEPIALDNAIEKTLDLTIQLGGKDGVVMGINDIPFSRVVPIEAKIGETHIWTITNNTDFSHPFHLHGYFFQVLDDGDLSTPRSTGGKVPEWKDTVDIPVGKTVRIAIKFDERPGGWMYHCHILDHAELGMMGLLHVGQ